jgi:hypothetical protein
MKSLMMFILFIYSLLFHVFCFMIFSTLCCFSKNAMFIFVNSILFNISNSFFLDRATYADIDSPVMLAIIDSIWIISNMV